jgi:SpoVK/Ycf46/Vps4 family AAA+-type ATPase
MKVTRAIVDYARTRCVVGFAEGLEPDAFSPGDQVFLTSDLNMLLGKSSCGGYRCGDTAVFDRLTGDGRMVLLDRDREIVVESAGAIKDVPLCKGDKVRFDKDLYMAFERIEREDGRQFFLDEVPDVDRDQVGGQEENLDTILSVLTQVLLYPEEAQQYGLQGRISVLMVGAPGLGKTLMAKVAASEITRLGGPCHFAVVKPNEWVTPWVGETEANIRNCFRALRDHANDGFVILFLDEIESVGRIRGNYAGNIHGDKFLAALLAELDGFRDRGNVAVISATNRKDLVDPALLERLSDIEIQVKRPDLRGAREIFHIHLPPTLPFSSNGRPPEATRHEMVERAVSRFYSPNADNEICELRFRDGTSRTVTAQELASGRVFEQVCRAARRTAFQRKMGQGVDKGLRISDMDQAVDDVMERLRSTLTPRNTHSYLDDLPERLEVLEVIPIVRKVKPHQYIVVDIESMDGEEIQQ